MEYLILILGFVPKILFHIMKGSDSMEWSVELVTSIVIPVLTVVVSIFGAKGPVKRAFGAESRH